MFHYWNESKIGYKIFVIFSTPPEDVAALPWKDKSLNFLNITTDTT